MSKTASIAISSASSCRRRQAQQEDAGSVDVDFQQVQAAVLRECSVNLVRVKEAIASNVAGTLDVGALDSWPGLIAGIKAGLIMLGKTRAAEIVDGIAKNLKELLQPGGTAVPPNYLDRLADAVVSLEYYMETLQAGRTDPWYMLDNAQTCLQALQQMPKRVVPTVPPLGPEAYAATVLLADAGATARAHALSGRATCRPHPGRARRCTIRPSRPWAPSRSTSIPSCSLYI